MEVLQIWVRNLETKREIREQIKKLRGSILADEWDTATEVIAQKVIASDSFREATDLFCYMDFDGEVGTEHIIDEAWRLGKGLWLPKVSGGEMEFYLVESEKELVRGTFGILEPTGKSEKAIGEDGLVIVPGIAFDKNHNRIGYGRGYYDRYLNKHPNLFKLALAFDIQLVDKIPADECDCRMDMVFTETLMY
jgi:5-formyltetrahydrofolate cyclo-ligase